jgi:hypothetical protein
MNMQGFTAEASIYKSVVTYVTGRTEVPVRYENALTPQQLLTLGGLTVNPEMCRWRCRMEHGLCRLAIFTCIDRCVANDLEQCVFASDPQACEVTVTLRCSERCSFACERQYATCLSRCPG